MKRNDLLSQPHVGYRHCKHFDFGTIEVRVFLAAIQNPIQVLFLDKVGIDENQPSYTETGKLFSDDTSGTGTADDCHRETTEEFSGSGTKRLGMAQSETASRDGV